MTKTAKKPRIVDLEPSQVSIQENFQLARSALCSALVERDDEIDLVLTAILAREHVLLVGEPGVAKSLLMRSIAQWLGGNEEDYFEYTLTKFTTPDELYGVISIKGIKEETYSRVIRRKLPSAKIVFLDELFRGSSAIINTTLTCMQERTYDNGDGPKPIPLITLMAASNEWPNDDNGGKDLGAFFDRFVFRKPVHTVSEAGERALLSKAVARDSCKPKFVATITPDEIKMAHEEAMSLPLPNETKKALWEIRTQLKNEGIIFGNRRLCKAVAAVRANAYLQGGKEVLPQHLEVLGHVLWSDPEEQPLKCAKIVSRIANPLGVRIADLYQQAQEIETKAETHLKDITKSGEREGVIQGVLVEMEEIRRELAILKQDEKRDKAIEYVNQSLKDWQFKLIKANPLKE